MREQNSRLRGWNYWRRKATDTVMTGMVILSTLLAIGLLFAILGYVLLQGITAVNLDFLTQLPKPVGEPGGGMVNAIVGTLILVAIACAIALPTGILAGVYLAEFGRNRKGTAIRFVTDVLTGIPSIAIGIFAYALIVLPMRSFSAIAGGVALGIIMMPIVTRTTEEMLMMVPNSLREASLALGIPEWRMILRVVVPTAGAGITTGAMLAIARAAGETAPLLFTALGNRYWQTDLWHPIAALPLQVFAYAIAPYDDWHAQAWAGALVLLALVLLLSVAARVASRNRYAR
ncbi:MAG: phosphate ABC transporter permease PstA [Chloroflexi bacterium]|nr:phosphate ABC transporter permease PstA [Chloroflexota bacterium]MDA8189023.1 phosphate ABC transporter permease PstA [Dehalococcoidales bacterium]